MTKKHARLRGYPNHETRVADGENLQEIQAAPGEMLVTVGTR